MRIIREGFGWIRKPHLCLGCLRTFKPSARMHYQRIASANLYTVWVCETCEKLKKFLEPEDDVWDHGFVHEELGLAQSPEMLLEQMHSAHGRQIPL